MGIIAVFVLTFLALCYELEPYQSPYDKWVEQHRGLTDPDAEKRAKKIESNFKQLK